MTRFVFWETTPDMLGCAMPLYAGLAALRMEWALMKLARKAGFDPTQPRVPAGNADGGQWTDAGGGGRVKVAANDRGEGGIAADAPPKSRDQTLNLPRAEREEARRKLVLLGSGGYFQVSPNPAANPNPPAYEDPTKSQVDLYDKEIREVANQIGISQALIRTMMYMETTHGNYYGLGPLADTHGISKSVLPMNIYAKLWGVSRSDMENPQDNIMMGAKILKGIAGNLANPTVETIATLYNKLSETSVTDYGARSGAVYRSRPWKAR